MKKILLALLCIVSYDVHGILEGKNVTLVNRMVPEKKFIVISRAAYDKAESEVKKIKFSAATGIAGILLSGSILIGTRIASVPKSEYQSLFSVALGSSVVLLPAIASCFFASYRFDDEGRYWATHPLAWLFKFNRDKYPYEKMRLGESYDDNGDYY
jgi:hypothetical protein